MFSCVLRSDEVIRRVSLSLFLSISVLLWMFLVDCIMFVLWRNELWRVNMDAEMLFVSLLLVLYCIDEVEEKRENQNVCNKGV